MGDAKTPRRWTTWLLVASLAINALIIFGLVGLLLGHGHERRDRPPRDGIQGLAELARAIPDPHRSALRDKFNDQRQSGRAFRREFRALRGALAEAVTAEPFDLAAVEAIIDRQETLGRELFGIGRNLILETIAEMPKEARAEFAERLQRKRTPKN